MSERILGWTKDFAPVIVSVVVMVLTLFFNHWQRRLGREQLRHQLYDRRMAVYSAFRELLLSLPEKDDTEIKRLFQAASIARAEVVFLFEDDQTLHAYLEKLCKRVSEEVINNIFFLDGTKGEPALMNDPEIAKESMTRAHQLGLAKLRIPQDYLPELPQQFAPFLKLTDFSK